VAFQRVTLRRGVCSCELVGRIVVLPRLWTQSDLAWAGFYLPSQGRKMPDEEGIHQEEVWAQEFGPDCASPWWQRGQPGLCPC
jgi:hypothetical protein